MSRALAMSEWYCNMLSSLRERNESFAHELIKTGRLEVTPHISASSVFSVNGYLDPLVPMDDVINQARDRMHALFGKGPKRRATEPKKRSRRRAKRAP